MYIDLWVGQISPKNLEFIINHVFLPPKLPDKADENFEEKDSALLGLVLGTAKAYQKQLPGPYPRWNSCVRMLSTMSDLQNGKSLAKAKLSNAIRNMGAGGNSFSVYVTNVSSNFNTFVRCFGVVYQWSKCWYHYASTQGPVYDVRII